ncbi:YafY family protein [uncultured Eudoraea sp.]|uniref:helix-turn-helix transcriptional regulator n=1 Tax=uncultured Eudoraea sp. TaxID=1035614 RepID=UPI002621A68F|nr:YafY family protein [uncultured Eudoraea sp.]
MNRIDRLVAILTTLQSKRIVTVNHIADKYEISERTVYRDLKALGEIGVPISFEENKGYTILQGFFLPPVSLTSEEANSLILITSLADKFSDKTTRNHVDNAMSKIKAVIRNSNKSDIDFLQSQIRIYKSPTENNSTDFLTVIQKSITEKQILHIEYLNNNQEKSQREIEPIGLTFYSNQWHLIAWCSKRKSYRDFKINQIKALNNTMESFRKSNHFDLNEYILTISKKETKSLT